MWVHVQKKHRVYSSRILPTRQLAKVNSSSEDRVERGSEREKEGEKRFRYIPNFILEQNDSNVRVVVAQLPVVVGVYIDAVDGRCQGAILVPVLQVVPAEKDEHLVGRVALIEHLEAVGRADDDSGRDERAAALVIEGREIVDVYRRQPRPSAAR